MENNGLTIRSRASEIHNYYIEFENLVKTVFEELGYEVELASRYRAMDSVRAIDIVARKTNGVVQPIEVKLIPRVTLAQLRDHGSQTARLQKFASNTLPLLIYGGEIDPSRRTWAQDEFQIKVWDRSDLLKNAGRQTRAALEKLFEKYNKIHAVKHERSVSAVQKLPAATHEAEAGIEPPPALKGDFLKSKLKAIAPGRTDAKAYEEICKNLIDYLFGDDLRDVRSQKRTTDKLNIYDLIYRVRPKHRFWTTLTRDFRARVVLFECKNYGKPIGAEQVFTTERYLSASALRPICFVLTRKPAHPHAVQAASSAMRETGKLLVFLSDIDIEKMLDAKDAQLKEGGSIQEMEDNDPTEILDQVVYDFIAGIPR